MKQERLEILCWFIQRQGRRVRSDGGVEQQEQRGAGKQLSVCEAEQSAAADEGAEDTALLTLRPHQTCGSRLADSSQRQRTSNLHAQQAD